jgi:transposase
MRRIREVLRLRDEFGFSQRQIADACRLPRSTVRDYLERLRMAGLRYEDVLGWTDIELEERLFPPPDVTVRPVPDWHHISHELARRGVTLRLLWQDYLDVHPGGYRHTQFVQHFRAWQAAHAQPRLRREHRPGAAIEVDYAGMTLTVGLGADARQAQVFVACLPYSGYLYAEATWTQQLEEWLASHVRLFEHLGGVPAKLVPDNPKVGVSHASFYDPAINPAFQDLARHYRTAVLPARVRRPRDKANAENGVQQIERRVLAPLRDVIFATLDAANAALRDKLAELNAAPLSRRPHHSRASLFAAEEQPTLRPLPPDRFVPGTWARHKVPPDYHLALDGGVYSVPYTLIGKTVDVHSTASVISVFLRGKRMACHARRQDGATVTLEAHCPANHRAVARYTPDHIHATLAEMSAAAALLFERILAGVDHPEQAVRAGLGLIRLAATHGAGRLEPACQAALEANVGSYHYVPRWLAAPPTAPADPAGAGEHANLRGPSYYH